MCLVQFLNFLLQFYKLLKFATSQSEVNKVFKYMYVYNDY